MKWSANKIKKEVMKRDFQVKSYKSLCGDRVWMVRGKERMLVEIQKFSAIKDLGLVFTGLPVEVYTPRSDYRHGSIIIRGQEMADILQHSDNKVVAKKLENFFNQYAGVRL